jgi:hypothetical protein
MGAVARLDRREAHTHQANKQGNLQLASIAETGEDDLTSAGN